MCAPIAIPIAAMALQQISNMTTQASNAEALNYNAGIATQQGQAAIMQGGAEAQVKQNQVDETVGKATAGVGASGVTLDGEGSSGKVVAQDAQLGAVDVAQINANAQRTAWGYDTQATLDKAQAAAAQKSSDISKGMLVAGAIGSTFLTGGLGVPGATYGPNDNIIAMYGRTS